MSIRTKRLAIFFGALGVVAMATNVFALTYVGNTTVPTINTSNRQGIDSCGVGVNCGVLQTFELNAITAPASLRLYLAVSTFEASADALTIKLCSYANVADPFPCDTNELAAWSVNTFTLPVFTLGVTPATTDLAMPDGMTLYPGVTYAIEIDRQTPGTANTAWIIENASTYADGEAFNSLGGCTNPYWVPTESTSGMPTCTDTGKSNYDVVFGLLGGYSAALTINVVQNGPEVRVYGNCVESADLPPGMFLDSNYVAVSYSDASASGTLLLATYDCDEGVYDSTESASSTRLWNGTFDIMAVQTGNPTDFTASTTVTITGSDVRNPAAGIVNCPFGLSEATSPTQFVNALACNVSNFVGNVLNVAPFSWYRQVQDVTTNGTGESTWSIGLPIPDMSWGDPAGTTEFNLIDPTPPTTNSTIMVFDSAATGTSDIAGKIVTRFPVFRQMTVAFVWIETGLWLAGLVWLFILLL